MGVDSDLADIPIPGPSVISAEETANSALTAIKPAMHVASVVYVKGDVSKCKTVHQPSDHQSGATVNRIHDNFLIGLLKMPPRNNMPCFIQSGGYVLAFHNTRDQGFYEAMLTIRKVEALHKIPTILSIKDRDD